MHVQSSYKCWCRFTLILDYALKAYYMPSRNHVIHFCSHQVPTSYLLFRVKDYMGSLHERYSRVDSETCECGQYTSLQPSNQLAAQARSHSAFR